MTNLLKYSGKLNCRSLVVDAQLIVDVTEEFDVISLLINTHKDVKHNCTLRLYTCKFERLTLLLRWLFLFLLEQLSFVFLRFILLLEHLLSEILVCAFELNTAAVDKVSPEEHEVEIGGGGEGILLVLFDEQLDQTDKGGGILQLEIGCDSADADG